MNFHTTPIAGLWVIETEPRRDERGCLTRIFCQDAFRTIRPDLRFVQVNQSVTNRRATVRGMHFQRGPALEAKLIRCTKGSVYDVVVDLRAGSPTFGAWHAVELSADNERELLIPEGCAHGFQALCDDVHLLYQHTVPYAPASEGGVRHDDPRLAIAWPLAVSVVSERDRQHPLLDDRFEGVQV